MPETKDTNQNTTDSHVTETKVSNADALEKKEITFAKFLESSPPSCSVDVLDLAMFDRQFQNTLKLSTPDIELFCENERCTGIRIFRSNDHKSVSHSSITMLFIDYTCSNCSETQKKYALAVTANSANQKSGKAYKFGELPAFGPRTPSRLISLIGPEREVFLKGRQCESQGLGIGAFAYYRRIVENQKNRMLDEIIKVAEKLSAGHETLTLLKKAKEEQRFSDAIEPIKSALPQALLLNGQNPLTLLHRALSEGLHAKEDEHCLQLAQDIRIVLAALAENIAQALKDEEELNLAINRLNRRK